MHPIIWHLPIAADDPQPSWSHAFPSWFAQQDPKECSEKDKILMLNHFLEHLDEVVKACSSEYFTTSKNYLSSYESEVAQAKVAQDTRIQGEVNKWLSSWNWNETTSLYGDHMCSMFRKQRTQPWLIKALKENPTTQFNSQLLYILDLEYSRSPFVAKDNHLFLKQTGYDQTCALDAPPGEILRHYLQKWQEKTQEQGLVQCMHVLDMLHPCPRGKGLHHTQEVRDALFRGFQQHRQGLQLSEAGYTLPSTLFEELSPS